MPMVYFQFFKFSIVKLDLLQTMYIYSLFPYPAVHHIVFQYRFHLKSVTKYATIIIQKEQLFHEMVDLRMSLKSTSTYQSMEVDFFMYYWLRGQLKEPSSSLL